MGGCDKTTPALLMGAISMNLPAIFLPAGPMLRGDWKGQFLGSGSDVWKYWAEKRAGNLTEEAWEEIENGIARSYGHCMTMGTASTMTSATEAHGPHAVGRGVDSRRRIRVTRAWRAATGRRIVDMVWEDLKPRDILTRRQLRQRDHRGARARRLDQRARAPGRDGAARAASPLTLDRFDELSRRTPLRRQRAARGQVPDGGFLLRRRPARAAARRSPTCSPLGETTVSGRTLGEDLAGAEIYNADVILPRERALVGSRAASRCCAAISRPTARSSSRPRRSRSC